jgi:hypothetical protein
LLAQSGGQTGRNADGLRPFFTGRQRRFCRHLFTGPLGFQVVRGHSLQGLAFQLFRFRSFGPAVDRWGSLRRLANIGRLRGIGCDQVDVFGGLGIGFRNGRGGLSRWRLFLERLFFRPYVGNGC